MENNSLNNTAARVTNIVDHGNFLEVEWEFHGMDDRVTTDFAWPGELISSDNGATIDNGWAFIEGAKIKEGDLIPLLNLEDPGNE